MYTVIAAIGRIVDSVPVSRNENIARFIKNRFYIGEMSYGKSVQEHVGSRKGKKVREEGMESDTLPLWSHRKNLRGPHAAAWAFYSPEGNDAGRDCGRYQGRGCGTA